jgi:hypothetical protein
MPERVRLGLCTEDEFKIFSNCMVVEKGDRVTVGDIVLFDVYVPYREFLNYLTQMQIDMTRTGKRIELYHELFKELVNLSLFTEGEMSADEVFLGLFPEASDAQAMFEDLTSIRRGEYFRDEQQDTSMGILQGQENVPVYRYYADRGEFVLHMETVQRELIAMMQEYKRMATTYQRVSRQYKQSSGAMDN